MFKRYFRSLINWVIVVGLVGYSFSGFSQITYATTNADGYTKTDIATNAAVHRGTALTVLSIELLDSTVSLTDTLVDADGVFGVTFNNTVIAPTVGDANPLTAFDTNDNIFWYDANSNDTYDAGELIWLEMGGADDGDYDPVTDGDLGIVGTAVSAVVADSADTVELDSLAASGLIHYHDQNANTSWDNLEDLVVDSNDNNAYNSGVDPAPIDGDGVSSVADTTAGSASGTSGTSALTSFVTGDNIFIYDAAGNGTWDSGADLIWIEKGGGDDGDFDPATDGDIAIAGTNTAATISDGVNTNELTATTPNSGVWAYYDETAGGGFSAGTDEIYREITAPDAGYTTGRILDGDQLTAFTVNNTAGTMVQAGSGVQDILYMIAYIDADGDQALDASVDTSLGTATRVGDKAWSWSGLSATINQIEPRNQLFVVAQLSQTAVDGRTAHFELDDGPLGAGGDVNSNGEFDAGDLGVYFASANDGPVDSALTNANVQTIKVYSDPSTSNPAAPTNVTVGGATNTSLTLSWTAPTNVSMFRIFRSTTTENSGKEIAVVNATNYVDTGLTLGTTYYYIVQSIGNNGMYSLNPVQVSGTTAGGTATPSTTPDTSTPTTTPDDSTGTPAVVIPVNPPATPINAKDYSYGAQWMGQTGVVSADGYAHEVSGAPGEVLDLELTLKNVGSSPWLTNLADGANWIKLGTWRPQDGVSPLYHSSWLSENRVAYANVQVDPNGQYVFRFKIQIPSSATVGSYYDFYVRPVAEWVKWFGPDGIFWRVKVA
ncbi:MAG: fibronectin type III domain-containing protein [Patescibacteria group bacterium]|nr:fibronectin type III domain-containing protein [Patescibacteria group bacterium]